MSPGAPSNPAAPTRADPKDKIEEYKALNRLMREGLVALRTKNYAATADRMRTLIGKGVDSFEVHYYFARALAGQRQCPEAAGQLARAFGLLPAFGQASSGSPIVRWRPATTAAAATLERGVAAEPRDPQLLERTAELWRRLERPDKAVALCDASCLSPRQTRSSVRLGELYRDAGRPDARDCAAAGSRQTRPEGCVRLERARDGARWDGRSVRARNVRSAKPRAVTRATHSTYNLGLVLERQGRRRSVELAQKALERNPAFTAARERLDASRRSR